MKEIIGGKIVVNSLVEEGVNTAFGLIGSAGMEIFDGLYDAKSIQFIGVRDERTGTHMADGYARASGKAGVFIAGQNGPGVTNLVTGLAQAASGRGHRAGGSDQTTRQRRWQTRSAPFGWSVAQERARHRTVRALAVDATSKPLTPAPKQCWSTFCSTCGGRNCPFRCMNICAFLRRSKPASLVLLSTSSIGWRA